MGEWCSQTGRDVLQEQQQTPQQQQEHHQQNGSGAQGEKNVCMSAGQNTPPTDRQPDSNNRFSP